MGCGYKASEGIVYFTHNEEIVGAFLVAGAIPLHPAVTGADLARVCGAGLCSIALLTCCLWCRSK